MKVFLLLAVTLIWNPNSETNLLGYKVYTGTNSRTYHSLYNVGNVTNWPAQNLNLGTNYLAVTAYGQYGTNVLESDYSNEVIWVETNAPGPVVTNGVFSLTNWIEVSSSPVGPWTNVLLTNVWVLPTNLHGFFRSRLEFSK